MQTRRYRVGLDLERYYRKSAIMCFIFLLLGVGATLGIGFAVFYDHDTQLVAEYQDQISTMEDEHRAEVEELVTRMREQEKEAAAEKLALEDQLVEVQRLHQAQQELSAADFALCRKYWYVFRDAPNNGTITMDVIRYADDQCKLWDINPHWLWHIYQKESHWTTTAVNSSSGARGIGQVLPSTGASYWETVLGHGRGSFNVSMLDDPLVNVEITTAHLGRDLANGTSFYDAVNHYSGGGGQGYWDDVISLAANHGITLTADNYHYQ